MRKIFTIIICLTLFSFSVKGAIASFKEDSLYRSKKTFTTAKEEHAVVRKFTNLSVSDFSSDNDPILLKTTSDDDSVNYYRAKAEAYHQQVSSQNAYVSSLNELLTLELPVGIASSNEDPNYAIIITQVKVNTQGAFVEAYLLLTIPNANNTKIAFRGKNIRFSAEGGLAGEGRLELVGDYNIPLGDKTMAWLLGKGNTFVEFDCNGFKGMGVEAEIQFSRDLIIPENPNGDLETDLNKRVKTKFAVQGLRKIEKHQIVYLVLHHSLCSNTSVKLG